MKILVFGDSFMTVEVFRDAFARIARDNDVRFVTVDETQEFIPSTASERSLREYMGSPRQLISEVRDSEVLVVQGAPVSEEVLAAGKNVGIVCCARGGPVNIDVAAATKRGIPVVTAPGKNATAVAELTIGLMIMLARNVMPAYEHVQETRIVGMDNFEGTHYTGTELEGKTLGLIGFGRVGSRVAERAIAFGMTVLVYDPFLSAAQVEAEGVRPATFQQVLASDFVSLHARESKENDDLMGSKQFAMMKPGSFFINTARPSLVDESALVDALKRRKIAGAALDVVRYDPARPVSPLIDLENVIVVPHIAGATRETTTKGAFIVASQLERHLRGEKMETVINPQTLKGR